jgi:hypothetical protein
MSFETDIEALTGLSIDGSSSPTETEITQFIRDGVIDVISKVLEFKPEEGSLFSRVDMML